MIATIPITRSYEKDGTKYLEVQIQTEEGDEKLSHSAVEDLIQQFKSGSLPFFIREEPKFKTKTIQVSWKSIAGKYVDGELSGDLKTITATIKLNKHNKDSDMFFGFVKNQMPMYIGIGIESGEVALVDEE